MAHSDPTDRALATIASIFDRSKLRRGAEKESTAPAGKSAMGKSPMDKSPDKAPAETSPSLVPADVDGYTKVGPGPIAAIRFKWTVRRADSDNYFVDEMVGENSTPKTSGPMPKEAAVRLVDDREAEARLRFEELRSEMNGRVAGTDFIRNHEA